MSDLLTHWAVFEDCRRLAQYDADLDPLFRRLIDSQREYGRLGAITRGGNRLMPAVLGRARSAWAAGDRDAALERKVGFVLGCLTHQACDKSLKPLLSDAAGSDWNSAHREAQHGDPATGSYSRHLEVSAYYDTHVFREVYLSGDEEPLNRFLLANVDSSSARALEEFIRSLFQRALLSSHTLSPDLSDPDRWLDSLVDLVQPLYVDVGVFVDVFQNPDPAKIEKYRVTTDFYRGDDPAIRTARRIQRGELSSSTDVGVPVVEGNSSHYGMALEAGLRYLRNASAFWNFETDELSTPNWAT